jgi:uncharacterized low-complexity protein
MTFLWRFNMNTSKTTLSLALTALIGATGIASHAQAAGSPFAMQTLNHGYQIAAADDKAMEGKCGGKQAAEGKCGGEKDSAAKASKATKEGKCGEGKCGGSKAKSKAKAVEGKCGGEKGKAGAKGMEGKCGGNK